MCFSDESPARLGAQNIKVLRKECKVKYEPVGGVLICDIRAGGSTR